MDKQKRNRWIAYLIAFVLSFALGIYLYYEWLLVLLLIAGSGVALWLFPQASTNAKVFVGVPLLGLTVSAIFGMFVLGDVWNQEGPTLEELASSGNAEAQYALGVIEIFKTGDEETELLAASAKQGNPEAQRMLGLLIAKDGLYPEYAYMFLRLAELNGAKGASGQLSLVTDQMSSEQMRVGEELLANWQSGALREAFEK